MCAERTRRDEAAIGLDVHAGRNQLGAGRRVLVPLSRVGQRLGLAFRDRSVREHEVRFAPSAFTSVEKLAVGELEQRGVDRTAVVFGLRQQLQQREPQIAGQESPDGRVVLVRESSP